MVCFELSTITPKEFFMRWIMLSCCFIFCAGVARAAAVPVGEQMRSVELQGQSDESGRWIQTASILYFNRVIADQVVDLKQRDSLKKIAAPFKGRFLKPAQADHLCRLIKDFLKEQGYRLDKFSCKVNSGILRVEFNP
jgi:hypothetical protein